MELAAWREAEAQSRDVPRSRVLKDDVLIEIAQSAPKNAEALANLRSFPKGMERSRSGRRHSRRRGTRPRSRSGQHAANRAERRGSNGATVELLKVLLRQVTEQTGVAAKMIATVEDLEAIASDDRADVPALRGWRRTIFGEKALELKRGRLALAVENGKVVTFDWHDAEPQPGPEHDPAPPTARTLRRKPAPRTDPFPRQVSRARHGECRHGDALFRPKIRGRR